MEGVARAGARSVDARRLEELHPEQRLGCRVRPEPAPGEVCRAGPLLHGAFRKRMFFAGEHTCFAYFGYMEGALQSGRRAASTIRRTIARERSKVSGQRGS